jgi:hypothetical protein
MSRFLDLVRSKYDPHNEVVFDIAVSVTVNKPVPIDQLLIVSLADSLFESCGEPGAVAAGCPAIQELDISGAKVRDWGEIVRLVE